MTRSSMFEPADDPVGDQPFDRGYGVAPRGGLRPMEQLKSFSVVRLTDAQMGEGQGGWYVRSATKDETTSGLWRLGSYRGPYTQPEAEAEAARRQAQEKEPFVVEAKVLNDPDWYPNGLRYPTVEAAEAYGKDLYGRWFGMEAYRVVDTRTGEVVS